MSIDGAKACTTRKLPEMTCSWETSSHFPLSLWARGCSLLTGAFGQPLTGTLLLQFALLVEAEIAWELFCPQFPVWPLRWCTSVSCSSTGWYVYCQKSGRKNVSWGQYVLPQRMSLKSRWWNDRVLSGQHDFRMTCRRKWNPSFLPLWCPLCRQAGFGQGSELQLSFGSAAKHQRQVHGTPVRAPMSLAFPWDLRQGMGCSNLAGCCPASLALCH